MGKGERSKRVKQCASRMERWPHSSVGQHSTVRGTVRTLSQFVRFGRGLYALADEVGDWEEVRKCVELKASGPYIFTSMRIPHFFLGIRLGILGFPAGKTSPYFNHTRLQRSTQAKLSPCTDNRNKQTVRTHAHSARRSKSNLPPPTASLFLVWVGRTTLYSTSTTVDHIGRFKISMTPPCLAVDWQSLLVRRRDEIYKATPPPSVDFFKRDG